MLITMGGLILDCVLAPASATDGAVGFELLATHTDLTVIGDKVYINAQQAAALWHNNRLRLLTLPRRNQRQQLAPDEVHRISAVRQIIETVNGQLAEQFNIEKTHARTFWGLCTRLYAKLTAHTLSIFVNRLTGNPNPLQIKALAFPFK